MERSPWDTTHSTTSSDAPTSAGGSVLRTEPYRNNYDRQNGAQGRTGARLQTRTKMVLHMQMRGFSQREIADTLGIKPQQVARISCTRRYQEHLDAKLDEVDDEFLRMKPQAIRAVRNGLESRDEALGLRAAETWFKAHGYKGFGRQPDTQVTVNITAEDVAVQLFNGLAARAANAGSSPVPSERPARGVEYSPPFCPQTGVLQADPAAHASHASDAKHADASRTNPPWGSSEPHPGTGDQSE